jgi:hypothetical protein
MDEVVEVVDVVVVVVSAAKIKKMKENKCLGYKIKVKVKKAYEAC